MATVDAASRPARAAGGQTMARHAALAVLTILLLFLTAYPVAMLVYGRQGRHAHGAVGNPILPKIASAFETKYGIRMKILEVRASELRERVRTEQVSGKVIGDVSHNGSTSTALQLAEGTFQPHGSLPNAGRAAAAFAVDELRVPIYVIPYGILVNTEMVKPAEEPKSWKDLLDPRFKGKIIADDMRALGGGAVFFMVTHGKLGQEFHEKLAAQQPHMNRELRGNYRRVARGEYPIYVPFTGRQGRGGRQALRRGARSLGRDAHRRRRPPAGAARPVRRRQDHDAPHDRGARGQRRRPHPDRRPGRARCGRVARRPARAAGDRHGLPVVRDLAAHDGLPERGVSPRGAAAASSRGSRSRERSWRSRVCC